MINYSLMTYSEYKDPFKKLLELFFGEYSKNRNDPDMFKVAPLFFACRGIICIHPMFYSMEWMKGRGFEEESINKINENKKLMIKFVKNILDEEIIEYKKINKYLKN